jgi:hypothetical protein
METRRRLVVWACVAALFTLPAALLGEVLVLKDGSEIKGKVVGFAGDTLTFEPSFGGRIRVHRDDIVEILFDETKQPAAEKISARSAGGDEPGVVSITFKDDKLTSKTIVTNKTKSREAEIIRANWIEQMLIVGRDTVYSRVDTTLDKTIYKGHEKQFKNTIRLEDMKATVPAGVHRCVVIVRNLGANTHEDAFDEGPLDLFLEFETVSVYADQTSSLRVGIKKGFMKTGKPKLYQVE